jgi:imidazolonepropionase-like amidohydrolase
MRRVKAVAAVAVAIIGILAWLAMPASAQSVVAATRNSTEFLRLADIGTLDAGKSADFLVLDANPLDDITNTRRIAAVILRGATVDRSQPVR